MTVIDLINLVLVMWIVAQFCFVALVMMGIFFIVNFIRKKKSKKKTYKDGKTV